MEHRNWWRYTKMIIQTINCYYFFYYYYVDFQKWNSGLWTWLFSGEVEQQGWTKHWHYLDREQPPYNSNRGTNRQVCFYLWSLHTCTFLPLVVIFFSCPFRLSDLERDDNYVLSLDETLGFEKGEIINCVSYCAAKGKYKTCTDGTKFSVFSLQLCDFVISLAIYYIIKFKQALAPLLGQCWRSVEKSEFFYNLWNP